MSLGAKIREARKLAGLTQDQVAESLDISKGAISQWETNSTTPTLTQFRAFCAATKASADELLLGKRLQGLEKRISALPEALREYVVLAIEQSEAALPHIPKQFLTPPTKQTYQAFHQYLTEQSKSVKSK